MERMAEKKPLPKKGGSPAATAPSAPPAAELTLPAGILSEVPDSPAYRKFCDLLLPRLILPAMSRGILVSFRNPDVTAERIGTYVDANPYFAQQLHQRVLSLTGKAGAKAAKTEAAAAAPEPMPRAENMLVQLGMESSRDMLVAIQAIRTIRGLHPDWGKDGSKLSFVPSEMLRYATRAEIEAEGIQGENAAVAYGAGLLFDLLSLSAATLIEDKAAQGKATAAIDAVFQHGLKTAQIASAVGRRFQDFSLRKYVFAAGLMHGAGRAILAILDPAFMDFEAKCVEKGMPRPVIEFAVRRRYGVSTALLSGAACMAMGIFRKAERALLFHQEPYLLLRAERKPVYQLAAIVRLASNMASQPKRIDQETDPMIALWKTADVKDLAIAPSELVSISKKI
jgi:hypothetical protein